PIFGSGGIVTSSPVSGGRIDTRAGGIAIQPDGKIVIVGSSYNTARASGLPEHQDQEGRCGPTSAPATPWRGSHSSAHALSSHRSESVSRCTVVTLAPQTHTRE